MTSYTYFKTISYLFLSKTPLSTNLHSRHFNLLISCETLKLTSHHESQTIRHKTRIVSEGEKAQTASTKR